VKVKIVEKIICNRSEIESYTEIFEKLSMSCCKSFAELESYTEIFEKLSVSLLSRRIQVAVSEIESQLEIFEKLPVDELCSRKVKFLKIW
jgi:hypothetical protein